MLIKLDHAQALHRLELVIKIIAEMNEFCKTLPNTGEWQNAECFALRRFTAKLKASLGLKEENL
jgi:hypothetical protein